MPASPLESSDIHQLATFLKRRLDAHTGQVCRDDMALYVKAASGLHQLAKDIAGAGSRYPMARRETHIWRAILSGKDLRLPRDWMVSIPVDGPAANRHSLPDLASPKEIQ